MNDVTIIFAKKLRYFAQVTCASFRTFETDHKYNARHRAADLRLSRKCGPSTTLSKVVTRQPKTFNLTTYKLHALGDYVTAIKTFGTTDSYSTQIVSFFLQSCPSRLGHFSPGIDTL
jgi:hypothetical protein